MELGACVVCGKIFMVSGRAICPACHKLMDIIYDKARSYLRDHPNENLNARELAKAIKEDAALVEILVMEGRFEKSYEGPQESEGEKKHRKMLEEFQQGLAKSELESKKAHVTYASERHGRK